MTLQFMRLKVNDIVWAQGITVKKMGTQNPYAYYLPIKATIGYIEEFSWGRVFHIRKLHKPKKYFRKRANTNLAHESFGASKKEVSTSFKKIQRLCKMCNASIRKS